MYNNQFNNSECDIYHIDRNPKFYVSWSPQESRKLFSKRQFISPKSLSKSVPHRNKSLLRYRINRSLSFDIGSVKNNNTYKSPNSSSDSASFESDEKKLSRSAKIMRALNLNISPVNSRTKLIKKSLNFDSSPSPKRLMHKSPRSMSILSLSTPSPQLNKTLSFDTSPSCSVIISPPMSNESMDENQNQTPIQRRSVKKSLTYLTPSVKNVAGSPNTILHSSPLLRSDLKEKIDNIVQMTQTPNVHSLRRSIKSVKNLNEIMISTPRNLFYDFNEDENEEPKTPENKTRIIPESMSSIKKSHKKERTRRMECVNLQMEIKDTSGSYEEETIKLLMTDDKRPKTPQIFDKEASPTYSLNSIKQSHKKDKSKKKSYHSEDEISENESIYDYSDNLEVSIELNESFQNDDLDYRHQNLQKETEVLETDSLQQSSSSIDESMQDISNLSSNQNLEPKNEASPSSAGTRCISLTPKNNSLPPENTVRKTPENRVNFLDRILSESIKKSHKKIKDENKKKLFRPKCLHPNLEIHQNESNSNAEVTERSGTPENVNSSRQLINHFSSVKKSHKKDKHCKILTASANRMKYFTRSQRENDNSKDTGKDDNKEDHLFDGIKKLSVNDEIICCKLSPNKKLKISSELFSNKDDFNDIKELETGYESDEEEFKIFTPIKRRSIIDRRNENSDKLRTTVNPNDSNEDINENLDISRCVTPVLKWRQSPELKTYTGCHDENETDKLNNYHLSSAEDSVTTATTDNDGRVTPKNTITPEILLNVNSIKKSHKKDKRTNSLRKRISPRIASNNSNEINCKGSSQDFKVPSLDHSLNASTSSFETDDSDHFKVVNSNNPQPSTSHWNTSAESLENKVHAVSNPKKTPPNSLRIKSYMRLLQSTSIKRSHKKVRNEKKKYNNIDAGLELSDDGSIFDENDRINFMQASKIRLYSDSRDESTEDVVNMATPRIVITNEDSRINDLLEKEELRQYRLSKHFNTNVSKSFSIMKAGEGIKDGTSEVNQK
ncbi:peptidyl-prolyl cis-trans isomerase G-like isoform X2 [Prorops nasuta]|uniref:peptidyl-prolyl cis-trans isomerase G-like isoform X2 n=1 Tax=Prorops nasuta TaxID=863751 RepID=UPI0034CF23DD